MSTQEISTPRTVALITMGCARNDVDSEELAGRLAADGWVLVTDPAQADVAVVMDVVSRDGRPICCPELAAARASTRDATGVVVSPCGVVIANLVVGERDVLRTTRQGRAVRTTDGREPVLAVVRQAVVSGDAV